MLVMNRLRDPGGTDSDDRGAVLLTVVIVMLVGFVIAAIDRGIRDVHNPRERHATRTAPRRSSRRSPGRDVAHYTAVADGLQRYNHALHRPPTSWRRSTLRRNEPTSSDGLPEGCPPAGDVTFVVVNSSVLDQTGRRPRSTPSTNGRRRSRISPGGTLAYFDGAFGRQSRSIRAISSSATRMRSTGAPTRHHRPVTSRSLDGNAATQQRLHHHRQRVRQRRGRDLDSSGTPVGGDIVAESATSSSPPTATRSAAASTPAAMWS